MSMKRYSGFLKRPEILETVYSVEDADDHAEDCETIVDKEKFETGNRQNLDVQMSIVPRRERMLFFEVKVTPQSTMGQQMTSL